MTRPNTELFGKYRSADDDIAGYEFARSRAHQLNTSSWPKIGVGPDRVDAEAQWDLVRRGEIVTDLFLSDAAARTATLGIMRLYGNWHAADGLQTAIVGPDSPLSHEPYKGVELQKNEEAAKRLISLDWGIVSVGGLTMVAAQRRILQTGWVTEDLHVPDNGRDYSTFSSFEVDKRSTFALDIERLADLDEEAAHEVRLIIICGMIASRDLTRLERAVNGESSIKDFMPEGKAALKDDMRNIMYARAKMQQYGITADEVMERAFGSPNPNHVKSAAANRALEQEITDPTGLLAPSTVTYYAERTLHRLERV